MSDSQLQDAFALIWEIREGQFDVDSEMTAEQVGLLRLLFSDLFPGENIGKEDWGKLIPRIAQADTEWNHKTMRVVNEIYALCEAGKHNEAEERRQEFLDVCPSAWYRDIVESV